VQVKEMQSVKIAL